MTKAILIGSEPSNRTWYRHYCQLPRVTTSNSGIPLQIEISGLWILDKNDKSLVEFLYSLSNEMSGIIRPQRSIQGEDFLDSEVS